MKEPIWIRTDVALAIHRRQISEHGGDDGLRDAGLLDSALAKPKNVFAYSQDDPDADVDLAVLAASYAFGIAKNHPFVDGNKRVAYVVCRTFLMLNGADVVASADEKYDTFLSLAAGSIDEGELAVWIRVHMVSC